MRTRKLTARCCALLAASIWSTCTFAAGPSGCFAIGEIILNATTYPDGSGGTTRALVRLDPISLETTLLYDLPSSTFYDPDITYDPFRRAVVAHPGNSSHFQVVDESGTTTQIDVGVTGTMRLTARGDGIIYFMRGNTINILDADNNVSVLLGTDGNDFNEPSLLFGSNSFYYHSQSNSIYYDSNVNFGNGIDEDRLVKLELNEDGTQVIARTESALVNTAPNNLDVVRSIGPGPSQQKIFYALDVNSNGLWGRAWTADTGTLNTSVFAEMGFFRAAATDYGVYSQVVQKAIMYADQGLRQYEQGDVDVTGSSLSPLGFVINHMMVIEDGCEVEPVVLTDTTPGTATNDGSIDAGEYENFSRGINGGFGNVIGSSSQLFIDSSDTGDLHFGLRTGGGALNDAAVIYIDSVPGGFPSTSALIDTADNGRAAISGNGTGGGSSDLTFASGFEADYAIVLESTVSSLFELSSGSHTFITDTSLNNVSNDYEINLSLADLGINPGDFFRYVVTYLNPTNAFRSDEFHGIAQSTVPFEPDGASNIGANAKSLASGDYNTFFSVGCTLPLNLVQSEWNLIGAPCKTGDATVESMFVTNGNLAFGDYFDGTDGTWAVYEYDAVAESYVQLALTDALATGIGYWIKTTEAGKSGNLTGSNNPSPTLIALTSDAAGRFNMVGHPYNLAVDWADVRVIDPSQSPSELTLAEADPSGACQTDPVGSGCVMSSVAYKWNGGAYDSFDGDTTGMEGDLEALDGFWVKAFKPGISLQIPLVPARVAARAGRQATALTSSAAIENRYGAWQVRLIAETTLANGRLMRDAGNFLGQLPDSLDGYDARDLPELAPFGDDYLTIVFAQYEWGTANGDYNSDHRRINRSGNGTWPFEVHTSLPEGTEVTISWEGPGQALDRAMLLDYTNSTKHRPSADGSYTFTVAAPVHNFAWQQRPWRN